MKWLQLARRDPGSLKSTFKFCEDHFDLPNDMENYTQYVIMGSVAKVKLKDGCLPSKFACQVDRQKRSSDAITDRTLLVKKQRILNSNECQHLIEQLDLSVADDAVQDFALNEPSDIDVVTRGTLQPIAEQRENPGPSKKRTKEVYFRSAGVQCSATTKCCGTSPQKVSFEDRGVMTSPMKHGQKVEVIESSEDDEKNEDDKDTNRSLSDFSPSAQEDSDDSFHDESFDKSMFANQSRSVTVKTVMRKPQFYLGYGGRTSDLLVVTESKFLDFLKPGDCLLADRGFKHIETALLQKGIKLVRPPSVPSGSKLTKMEVRQTRSIACLRIHIERVIRRIREFSMLNKYACTNCNLVKVLDECVVIACALINLQNALIR
ncbi:hypothetical protein JTE90_029419 [Oedothorax gibbosus]|uniref:DDE Tnp4 domain-containing protein n=1 Tax=Oedothorax gibbosus TaxID=931172 RepID=A0AAV6TY25_9ARAC|nr:hypothetical protein JTE90_029419 [Oedothorax gibbosus]